MSTAPDSVAELRSIVRRQAAVGRLIDGRPTADPYRSCLGRVSVVDPDQGWPSFAGRPMAGLAQLNLTESTFAPAVLSGLAFVSIWIAEQDDYLVVPDGHSNGDGWTVRAYPSAERLAPVDGSVLQGIRPHLLRWEVVDDYPDWDDLIEIVDTDRLDELLRGRDPVDVVGAAEVGTKLGGWPTLIQSEISWAPYDAHPASPTFCFQIDTDQGVGLNLWDGGVLHIGLGAENGKPVWVAESQSM